MAEMVGEHSGAEAGRQGDAGVAGAAQGQAVPLPVLAGACAWLLATGRAAKSNAAAASGVWTIEGIGGIALA
jgi:hypothetical protein